MTILPEPAFSRLLFSKEYPCTRINFLDRIDSIFREIVSEYAAAQHSLLFDLSALDGIDSAFVTILVQTLRNVPHEKVAVYVTHPGIHALLSQLGLDSMVRIFQTEKEIEAFSHTISQGNAP
jgi:anti-anti-sigma regulatory factor